MFISLPFGMSLMFLLGLLSAVLIVVVFRHLAIKSLLYYASFIFIWLFSSAVAITVSPLLCSLLWLPCRSLLFSAIFNSSHHFYCHAILITTVPFYRCSASNIAAFHSRLDLELPFLLWSCRRHIHFLLNTSP